MFRLRAQPASAKVFTAGFDGLPPIGVEFKAADADLDRDLPQVDRAESNLVLGGDQHLPDTIAQLLRRPDGPQQRVRVGEEFHSLILGEIRERLVEVVPHASDQLRGRTQSRVRGVATDDFNEFRHDAHRRLVIHS